MFYIFRVAHARLSSFSSLVYEYYRLRIGNGPLTLLYTVLFNNNV